MRNIILLVVVLFMTGCTSVKVQEMAPSLKVSHVCIQDNPKVIVADFIHVVRKGFERHGITTEIFKGKKPSYCEHHLTYTAFKTWDIGMYMHHAELQLYRGFDPIAYAEYHLNGEGGLALNKWASVKSKMDPVIDRLLAGYTPESVAAYRKPIADSSNSPQVEGDGKAKRLRDLKFWFSNGLITEQEYQSEKRKVLSL